MAKDLGICAELLYRWKSEQIDDTENAVPSKGRMKRDEEHVKRLEHEFAQTRQEVDIFQKSPGLLF